MKDTWTTAPTTDLLTRLQADGRYVNEGQASSISSAMLQDGATLAEILDDDGAGTTLDADLLDGSHATAFAAASHNHWGATWTGSGTGLTLSGGTTGLSGSGSSYGVYGTSSSGDGVHGVGSVGVAGESTSGTGVGGSVSATSGTTYGVVGVSVSTSGRGVVGNATATSGTTYGVAGVSASTSGYGVAGNATATSGATSGVYGESDSSSGYGGFFLSDSETSAAVKAGAYGRDDSDTGFGVAGHNYWGGVGVGAWSYSGRLIEARSGDYPGGILEFYIEADGDVFANGTYNTFKATGGDEHRTLYGMTSAEAWAEDFGSAALKEGKATVTIDPIFARTVNLAVEYHVYLTPLCQEAVLLFVTDKGAASFTVQGVTLDGKPSACGFDYRIVAKQRGYETVRLEEVEIPAPVAVEKEKEQ